MTRVHHVKKAAKDYEGTDIKKGDEYWWWKFRRDSKRRMSSTRPRRSQLTQSEHDGTLYDIEDGVDAIDVSDERESIRSVLEEAADAVESLGEDTQSKLDNVLEKFPNGCPTAELLEARVDACATLADELRNAAGDIEDDADDEDVEAALGQIGWDHGG